MTAILERTRIDVDIPVSVSQCRKWVATQQFINENGEAYPLTINQETVIPYYAEGKAYPYSGPLGTEVSCQGNTVKIGSVEVDQMVIMSQVKVTLQEVQLEKTKATDGAPATVSHPTAPGMKCADHTLRCKHAKDTYIWTPTINRCPYTLARTFDAMDVHYPDGKIITINGEDQALHFVHSDRVKI